MISSSATVTAQVGSGIDPSLLDDAIERGRAACALYPVGTLDISVRRTGHPAMPDAVLADIRASMRGRRFRSRAVASTFDSALDHALERLAEQLDRHATPTAV
ncbi:hypothetical protein QRX60_03550 [Amycolatopsis mongoliensis]|uniref:Uncharacterized protein n=1 Tax=Amycolatopsis mongoliensis TaxID=715475 RepID=A0A9Y2NKM3_9PSEU|nr:hypothetical protein [Amycolatopsis sp. 4-36]WIY02958.1 hypothetical protein QRX60_03550 [Amycolatopsis sp. 4-36]